MNQPGSGLNTATNAGKYNISKPQLNPVKHPDDNRFTQQLTDMQNTAAFGLNVGKVLTAKSGGRKDYSRDIQFSIRREFFTFKQFIIGMFWAIILGLFIGTLIISTIVPGAQWDIMAYPSMTIGVFVLSAGIADLFSEAEAFSSVRSCTPEKQKIVGVDGKTTNEYIVDAEYRGAPCLTVWDCTKGGALKPGQRNACSVRHGSVVKFKRRVITPLILIAGIILVVYSFTASSNRPSPKNLVLSIIYGIFTGTALSLLFS